MSVILVTAEVVIVVVVIWRV